MSFWQVVKNALIETEQDVIAVIAKIRQDGAVAVKDVEKAIAWAANNAPVVASEIESVVQFASRIGIASNPEFAAAIVAADAAVAALDAFAKQYKSQGATLANDASAAVAGYVAAKQAQGAAALAAAAAASPAPKPAAPKPAAASAPLPVAAAA